MFDVEVRERDGWTMVRPQGPVDAATAPRFQQALAAAQHDPSSRVLVALDDVEMLDEMGIGALVGALMRARAGDGRLVLACSRPRLRDVLELARLVEIVEVVDDPSQVLPG